MSGKEESKIQKITELLEKGGTMLASHHGCGAPMFRYQGKIVCPVCDFQEKLEAEEIKGTMPGTPGTTKQPPVQLQVTDDYQAINRIIMNKIHDIAASLETETDLGRVKNKMECIEQGMKILKLLHEEKEVSPQA